LALTSGTRLGPYEITAPIGAGGMGEVYKARDTRLDRTVAIKVLPATFAEDPVLRQRLEREARAISALDHPHICSLYDVGAENGVEYLVMQFVTGETLAERLARGPMPSREVSTLGAQIADALAAAHARGIIHRDLKPGNIMLTREGVRLLDFGLAKHYGAEPATEMTMPGSAPLTAERTIVGTLHYMAPEQLEGRELDPRADIFALGAVLYEMLSGGRAFEGESSASVIAAIMNGARRPLTERAPNAPPALVRLIDRCLAIDPRDRWQSAGDLGFALRDAAGASSASNAAIPVAAAPRRRPWLPVALAIALGLAIAAIGWMLRPSDDIAQLPELRLSVVPPDGLAFSFDVADIDPDYALSPDGRQVVFVAVDPAGERRLYVRDLGSVVPRELAGTTGASRPFWSPDGHAVGYITAAGLSQVRIDAGRPQPISSTVTPSGNASATWTNDGRIIYEATIVREGPDGKGLFVVPATGGTARPLSPTPGSENEQAQRYPVALPDGEHFLYLSWTPDPDGRGVYLGSLRSDRRSRLVPTGFRAGFVAPDLLLYVRDRVLMAQRFSIAEGRMLGEPQPVVSGFAIEGIPGQATFDVSPSGAIAYRSRSRQFASELRWFDRSGASDAVLGSRSDIAVALAPNGRHVALARVDITSPDAERFSSNLWLLDLSRRVVSRFTLDAAATDENPVWSPGGTEIAYAVHRTSGLADVRVQATIGSAPPRVILEGPHNYHPIHWASDGTLLLHAYATGGGADDLDLYLLAPGEEVTPTPLIVSRGFQAQGQFSPDARWIAYTSNESGRPEVYVRPRDGRALQWQISSEGGAQPRWRGDGREIFYVSLDGTLTAVPVTLSPDDVTAGVPVPLFTEPTLRTNNNVFYYGGAAAYDVTPDGKRFLVNRLTQEPTAGPLHLVLQWPRP
jgi:Tol biopolymer transport system component